MRPRSSFVTRLAVAFAACASFVAAVLGPGEARSEKPERPPFDPSRAGFSIALREQVISHDVFAVFAMPEEQLVFTPTTSGMPMRCRVLPPASDGQVVDGSFSWIAPKAPGLYPIRFSTLESGAAMTLNVFVMVPIAELKNEKLNGYRIGQYPQIAYKGLDIYRPPRGFVEVTEKNRETRVSPHFTLGQFLCKQAGGWPKYLVLREHLVLKLELLLEKANEAGHRCDSFVVMSGYRTPYYNHQIGNVKYSRHQWGGAADIYIDENPRDGVMDDLNGNGRSDVRDAHVLYGVIDRMYGKKWYEPFVGGLGAYRKTSNHGPFVHVDARGFRARWGD